MAIVEEQLVLDSWDVASRPVEVSERSNRRRSALALASKLAVGALAITWGGAVGAEIGVAVANHTPTRVQPLPDMSLEAQPIRGLGAVIDTGLSGAAVFPELHQKMTGVGTVSVRLRTASILIDDKSISEGAALIHDPAKIIEKPVTGAITKHIKDDAELGGEIGLAMTTAGLSGFAFWRRRRQQQRQTELATLQTRYEGHLNSTDPAMHMFAAADYDDFQRLNRSPRNQGLKRIGAAVLMLSTIAGGMHIARPSHSNASCNTPAMAKTDPSLLAGIDKLAGACVTANSILDRTINTFLQKLEASKTEIDAFYQAVLIPNLHKVLADWSHDPANQIWFHDPNLVPIVLSASEHASVPFATWEAPEVYKDIKAQVIVRDGNVAINTGVPFLNKYLLSLDDAGTEAAITATRQKVTVINTEGDRDDDSIMGSELRSQTIPGPDGKSYHPNAVLDADSSYSVTVDGLTFVGAPDPQQNIYGQAPEVNGKPANQEDIEKALANVGETVAKTACKAYAQNKVKPVIVVNRREMAYAAIESGCAGDVFSGEGPDGSYSYTVPDTNETHSLIIAPSVSGIGDGESFTPYMKPVSTGKFYLAMMNKHTGAIEVMTTLSIDPSGEVSVPNFGLPPDNSYDQHEIRKFLNRYDPLALANSAPEQLLTHGLQ